MATYDIVCAMIERLIDTLPTCLHPRFPLVANELRAYRRLDIRIAQLSQRFVIASRSLSIILMLAVGGAVLVGPRLFGFLLFPVTVVVVPLALVVSELLLLRSILSIPSLSAQMIAGEIEQGTWDPLLSTPLPRYQIILSKFSALLWNSAHVFAPLLGLRVIAVSLILVEGLTLEYAPVAGQSGLVVTALCVLIVVLPLVELTFAAATGLLMSFIALSSRQANGLAWSAWLFYRLGSGIRLATLLTTLRLETLPFVAVMVTAPHLLIVANWVQLDLVAQLGHYSMAIGLLYGVVPVLLGIISLVVVVAMVQYQSINPLRLRRGL